MVPDGVPLDHEGVRGVEKESVPSPEGGLDQDWDAPELRVYELPFERFDDR
jgi:hypothetical protein